MRADEACAREVRVGKVRGEQVGIDEDRVGKIRTDEIGKGEFRGIQIDWPTVKG